MGILAVIGSFVAHVLPESTSSQWQCSVAESNDRQGPKFTRRTSGAKPLDDTQVSSSRTSVPYLEAKIRSATAVWGQPSERRGLCAVLVRQRPIYGPVWMNGAQVLGCSGWVSRSLRMV